MIKKLNNRGYDCLIQRSFKAPAASVFLYGKSNLFFLRKMMVFETDSPRKISAFAENLLIAWTKYKKHRFSLEPDIDLMAPVKQFLSKQTMGRLFYRNLMVNRNCIGYGACADSCPEGNLKIESGQLIVLKKNDCQRCLRCVQVCP